MKNNENLLKLFFHLDSACISDALDSFKISGGLVGIQARVNNTKCVGFAYTVKYDYLNTSPNFMNAANYIDDVPLNSVIIIDNGGRSDCTNWGEILANYAVNKKILGTVINGSARDIEQIRKLKYPLFSKHIFMQSAKNRAVMVNQKCDLNIEGIKIRQDDLIFCDENGCIVIPIEISEEIAKKANNIKWNEGKILQAILSGSTLEEARRKHNYARPWEK